MTTISLSDLKLIDTTPLVKDLTLASALGFAEPRDVRKLIKRRVDELGGYGGLRAMVARYPDALGRERPTEEYWLSEPQALLICMFARTDRAAEVRAEIIGVFMAWRHAQTYPLLSEIDLSLDAGDRDQYQAKLSMLRECRLIFGRGAAKSLWRRLGLPAIDDVSVGGIGGTIAGVSEVLDQFLRVATTASPSARVQSSVLYDAFRQWCSSTGLSMVCSQKAFSMAMDRRGLIGKP